MVPYILAAFYIALQLITGGNYPIFRDEFYYIDCANHLSFGYVDHPPFSIFVLAVWEALFGDSQLSIRVIPAICGALLILLAARITSEMSGSKWAQVFTSTCVFAIPNYLGVSAFTQ